MDETRQVISDAKRLVGYLSEHPFLAVAFSGGVDSSVVLAAAKQAGLKRLIAVTAHSASVAGWQLKIAKQIADELAVEHWVAETAEISRPEYRRNDSSRCFFCKETLYQTIQAEIRARIPSEAIDDQSVLSFQIVSGTNHDDLGDYRPGIQAGSEAGVLTPLADLGLNKQSVRALAEFWQLPNHDLPASPCLASRLAYGVEVTAERLKRVEEAEKWLHDRGFRNFRVRLHQGELARIEVSRTQQPTLCDLDLNGELSQHFRELGFQFVTLDLQGFTSGSLNRTVVSIGGKPTGKHGPKSESDDRNAF